MGEYAEFTADEWRTLQFAPFWLFSAVVGRYRNFDDLEYEAFSWSLRTAAAGGGQLTRDVLVSVATDCDTLIEEFAAERRPIASGLCAVAAILTKAPNDEADMFKDSLLSGIGERIARARGRFGRVMSDEDEKTLALVAELLY